MSAVSWGILFCTNIKVPDFELFSDATSVCHCYMSMWNILQSNLTTQMDNIIKLKQQLDKSYKNNDQKIKTKC